MSLTIKLCLGQYEITRIATTFSAPPPFYHLAMMEELPMVGACLRFLHRAEEEEAEPVPIKTAVFEYTGPSREGYVYHLKSIVEG
jgi:hypothetical protein